MKKLAILLLATVMLFTCFALAACGDGEESSTPSTSTTASGDKSDAATTSGTSSEATTSSKDETTSTEPESSEPESSEPETSEPETSEPETSEPETSGDDDNLEAGDAETFWITHYDTYTEEGAGMILTEDCDYGTWDGAWCDHYAFKPIDGVENGYELVELAYGTIAGGDATYNGSGHTLAVPAGGFVYATSIGNNYTSDGIDTSKPDYVNDSCNAQISRCRTWKVGDKFIITGMDLNGKTVPTTTDDKNWYDSGYVCTATIAPLA